MQNVHIWPVTGKIDDSFIGIKIKNNRVDFYYPETYCFSKEENLSDYRNDFLSILKTINIAKTLSSDKAKVETTLDSNDSFAMLSYLWIINDYLANGIYVNREKVYKNNQNGRINWKRTLKNQPIISNGNVIYNDVVVESKNKTDNIMVDIHRYCVKKSIDFIGWLFKIDSSRIESKPFNDSIKKIYISVLRQEIDKTFDDYKKLRLNHMLKVIKGLNGNNNDDEFVFGVDSYYYIFERMVDYVFGNQKNMKDFNPKANWYLARNSFKKTPSSELRPDSILIKDEIAYILDSKYYRFGFTGDINDLPETTSIQKQITYGDYLKKNGKTSVKAIRNAFIMPFNSNHNVFDTDDVIHYIGYSLAEWRNNNSENAHEAIYAFLVDLRHIISIWNNSFHDEEIDMLVQMIEKAVNDRNNNA